LRRNNFKEKSVLPLAFFIWSVIFIKQLCYQ
jgi:hypothetical protein